jgi:glycosyltransferase involved in cell wall biosynthesis
MKFGRPLVYMIAPVPILARRTRLKKQADVLVSSGFDIRFFGWERTLGEAGPHLNEIEHVKGEIILRGGGYASRLTHFYYLLWMVKVFFKVLTQPRQSIFFCLGFETAFPALLAGKCRKSQIVFDDADRLSMIMSLPRPAKNIIERLEKWASYQSAVHLVPGFSRYNWKSDKMRQLRNCPNRADFETAEMLPVKKREDVFTLYANGWIGETRGAPIFLELMARLGAAPFLLKIIGRGDGAAYDELVGLSNVEATGEVPQIEALVAYREADLVLTYYDPKISINRRAESNKWGDCIYLGLPFIVNSEVKTASRFLECGGCFSVDYDDVEALEALVRRLANNHGEMDRARHQISKLRREFLPFDEAFKEILFSGRHPIIKFEKLTKATETKRS